MAQNHQSLQTADVSPATSRNDGWFEADGHAERVIRALESGDPDERVTAAETVAGFRVRAAENSLIECLAHRNSRVREAAAPALGFCGSARCVGPVAEALLAGNISLVAARKALRGLGSDANAEIARLTLHESPLIRSLAVREMSGREGSDAALSAALIDGDESVRIQALLSLSDRAGSVSIDVHDHVIELSMDPSPSIRAASCPALGTCGTAAGRRRLHSMAEDPDAWVARCARESIGRMNTMRMARLSAGDLDVDPSS